MTARRDAGLTLLELAAAMAIFSLVAVMALQGMTAALAAQARQSDAADETRSLAVAVTLLRRDLSAMVPATDGGAAFQIAPDLLSFVAAGQPRLPDGRRDQVARIGWRLDGGRLLRTARPLAGAESEQVVLENVGNWSVRALGDTWLTAWTSDPAEARLLPRAVEVRFSGGGVSDLRILVAR